MVGDRITAVGIDGIVQSIATNTSLTLSTSATVGVGIIYTITPQAVSARVTTWADQSGNGRDFTQSGTARPIKQTISGYPALVFDNANDWMLGPNFADNLASFTVFTIARSNIPAGGDIIISKVVETFVNSGWAVDAFGAEIYVGQNDTNFLDANNDLSNTNILKVRTAEFLSISALPHVYINGSNLGESNEIVGTPTTYTNTEPVRLGVTGATLPGGVFYSGILRAVMIYSPAPNAADRAAIEAWLAARYGITL